MRKLKSILFILMTMASVAILTTSCNQTDSITEEISETNTTLLAKQLADNPNFQASIKIQEQIGNDLKQSIEDNKNISNADMDMASTSSLFTTSKNEFVMYKTNLLTDMPELNSLTEQSFEKTFSLALNLIEKQTISSRNCSYQHYVCVYYNAYIKYYYGSISYNSYVSEYNACLQQYYNCISS